MKLVIILGMFIFFVSKAMLAQEMTEESLKYLQQSPPGLTSKIFAPEIVSKKNEYEFGSVFSKDGKEFYYAITEAGKAEIWYMKLEGNQWTAPEKIIYSDQYGHNDPFLSPDEKKLFFISNRPLSGSGEKKDIDIWYVEKESGGWSTPINAGKMINSDKNEYYISFTNSGKMYFASNVGTGAENNRDFDIFSSTQIEGKFQEPHRMGPSINTKGYEGDVFVAYDESYLIFCAERKEGYGQGDLYISFKNEDGTWKKAKNMGSAINTANYEFCPFVTKDGKYLFYSGNRDIYWVDAKIIDGLR